MKLPAREAFMLHAFWPLSVSFEERERIWERYSEIIRAEITRMDAPCADRVINDLLAAYNEVTPYDP